MSPARFDLGLAIALIAKLPFGIEIVAPCDIRLDDGSHVLATAHVAIDFFVVPSLTFRLVFAFIVLRHDRRELVHVNVTDQSTAAWAAQQIVDTFPNETVPRYLLRDRDAIYGHAFHRRVDCMGMHQVLIAPHAPWQNPFAERVIGSIRRECLDHFIVLTERHLRRLLRAYLAYYNTTRPHQALGNNSPRPREVQPPAHGRIIALPEVGGVHHRYQRAPERPPSCGSSSLRRYIARRSCTAGEAWQRYSLVRGRRRR